MAITKERKQRLVMQYQDLAERCSGIVFTTYSGLTVKDIEDLRRRIREVGGEFHIIKNTLAQLAFQQAGVSIPEDALSGATAIGFAEKDVISLIKPMSEVAKTTDFLRLKCAVIDGEIYDGMQVERLADLPPLPVLQAQLIGLIQSPTQRIAGAVAGAIRQVAGVLKAYSQVESEAQA